MACPLNKRLKRLAIPSTPPLGVELIGASSCAVIAPSPNGCTWWVVLNGMAKVVAIPISE